MGLFKKKVVEPERFVYVSGKQMTEEEMENVLHNPDYKIFNLDNYVSIVKGSVEHTDASVFKMLDVKLYYDTLNKHGRKKSVISDDMYKTYIAVKTSDIYQLNNYYQNYPVDLFNQEKIKDIVILSDNYAYNAKSYVISKKEAEILRSYDERKYDVYVNDKCQHDGFDYFGYTRVPESRIGLFKDNITKVVLHDIIYETEQTIYYVKTDILMKDYVAVKGRFTYCLDTIFDNWVKKEDYDNFINQLKQPHKVNKIIGTEKPPYFIVNGKIIESKTENWYEFCLHYFFDGEVQKWMLEEK